MLDKLKEFQKKYPNLTSADLQSFTLGMQAREDEIVSLRYIILKTIESLAKDQPQTSISLQKQFVEHDIKFGDHEKI